MSRVCKPKYIDQLVAHIDILPWAPPPLLSRELSPYKLLFANHFDNLVPKGAAAV